MKISSYWLINWLNALVQDFDEVAIVNICCLGKSSYNPGFGVNPNREGERSHSAAAPSGFFIYADTHKHC